MNCRSRHIHGFSLLETMIAVVVLATGIVSVSHVFSYTVQTTMRNRQRTAATILLVDKLEQFHSLPFTDSRWNAGGSLHSDHRSAGYFDHVTSDGSIGSHYLRTWQVSGTDPRSVTVVVYGQSEGVTERRMELARGTTTISASFTQ
jgi:prepilin-type N-terminal cleavage/methylation domain-containing protein